MKHEIITWIGTAGAACTGLGSLLLAWRVRTILKWVGLCITAHDESITQLRLIAQGRAQTGPIIEGSSEHLARVEAEPGLRLLVAGFALLGIGGVCTAITHLL